MTKKTLMASRPTKKQLNISYVGVDAATSIPKKGSIKYRSRIKNKGICYYLGLYETPEAAAKAYNKKAKNLFGGQRNAKKNGRWNKL